MAEAVPPQTPPKPRPVRQLSEVVANQIAAGEVVERPASVVKELVENALDAGATRIDVAIEGGGSKCVTVDDNGHGMARADALASLERQATSKIATSADIERIATFGFRGEAVPSIASVSRFRMVTRLAEDDAATELIVTGGVHEETQDAARPIGTTVEVRDLFFNVPARRKFLRAPATELSRIRQTLIAIALAHPTVAFRLQSEGRDLFRLPEGDTLPDRVRVLLGEATAEALLPVDWTQGEIHVSGFLAKPEFVRGGTPEQYVFVNHRPASAAQIQYALREAWPVREHRPVVVLFVDLPPEGVDVNVHPAKREVRFRQGNRVIDAVIAAVSETLKAAQPIPPAPPPPPPTISPVAPMPTPQAPRLRQEPLMGWTPPARAPVSSPYPAHPPPTPPTIVPLMPPPPPPPEPTQKSSLPWVWVRVADILPEGYWLVVTDQGYVTVDAKAALERIHYERLAASAGAVASQPLLLPETLRLPPADAERVARFLPELEACGFGLGALGNDTFMIDALPVAFAELPPKEILADLAEELDQTGVKKGLDAWRREVVARAAAKAACRVFHVQTVEAAEQLVARLAECAMPYITPRGRPVMILTTYRELARRFRREG